MDQAVRTSREARRLERGARRAKGAVDDARAAGLLEGERDHVTFRAPRALVEAALRNSGVQRKTDLGVAALAMLAQRDPFVEVLMENFGALGPDHTLDY